MDRAERDKEIVRLYREGVRKADLSRMFGINPSGIHRVIEYREGTGKRWAAGQAGKNAYANRVYGCDHATAQSIRERLPGAPAAYQQHRKNAGKRKIEWLFTLPTWVAKWEESGRFHERGQGGACMARHRDTGPYSPDNVTIMTTMENVSDHFRWARESRGIENGR